jgi:hypothetical protein
MAKTQEILFLESGTALISCLPLIFQDWRLAANTPTLWGNFPCVMAGTLEGCELMRAKAWQCWTNVPLECAEICALWCRANVEAAS